MNSCSFHYLQTKETSNMLRKKLLARASSSTDDLHKTNRKKLKPDDPSASIPKCEAFAEKILQIQLELNTVLKQFNFVKPPVDFVYNPMEYAFNSNEIYIRKYCTEPKKLLFVGMNPGPFGMCQTGIPFGDVYWVRNWLKTEGVIEIPPSERQCPDKPILGFDSTRKEQSGTRFWGFFAELCGSPQNFFKHSFVYNYCPLAFLKKGGANIIPPSIKTQDRKQLESSCDDTYLKLIELLQPEIIIGVGEYSEKRTLQIFKSKNFENPPKVIRLPHPSPRALHNHNWPEKAAKFLTDHNLNKYFTNKSD